MLETVKPIARTIKYTLLSLSAERRARRPRADEASPITPPPAFVVGGGRSGTTILGKLLQEHPEITYLFEPYHLWAAVEPVTDVLNLYHRINPCLLMDARHHTTETTRRFHRVFKPKHRTKTAGILVEKTPLNAFRIGFLEALAPGAKFIHLVRDGVDVSQSIASIATANGYKMWGKAALNQWWGVGRVKWETLARDGAAAGYFEHELPGLKTEQARAAYEWLVSLAEVDRWRKQLAERLYELSYEVLTRDSSTALQGLCQFLGIRCPADWLNSALARLDPPRRQQSDTVELPPGMCRAFNEYQARFGFAKHAVIDPRHTLPSSSLSPASGAIEPIANGGKQSR